MPYHNNNSRTSTDTNKGRHHNQNWEIIDIINKLFNFGFLTKEECDGKTKYQVWMFPEDFPMFISGEELKQWMKNNPAKVIYEKISKVDDYVELFFVPKFRFKNRKEYLDAGHIENYQINPTTIENFDEFDIKISSRDDCYYNNSKSFSLLSKESVEFYLGVKNED